jgi:hypothetical protein
VNGCVKVELYTLTSAHMHWQGECQDFARAAELP